MLGAGLKRALERAGYAADWARTGEEAIAAAAAETYALILLDLGLPETSGLEALREIRRRRQTCLLYTSPSPRDRTRSRMPSSA